MEGMMLISKRTDKIIFIIIIEHIRRERVKEYNFQHLRRLRIKGSVKLNTKFIYIQFDL